MNQRFVNILYFGLPRFTKELVEEHVTYFTNLINDLNEISDTKYRLRVIYSTLSCKDISYIKNIWNSNEVDVLYRPISEEQRAHAINETIQILKVKYPSGYEQFSFDFMFKAFKQIYARGLACLFGLAEFSDTDLIFLTRTDISFEKPISDSNVIFSCIDEIDRTRRQKPEEHVIYSRHVMFCQSAHKIGLSVQDLLLFSSVKDMRETFGSDLEMRIAHWLIERPYRRLEEYFNQHRTGFEYLVSDYTATDLYFYVRQYALPNVTVVKK